MKLLSIIRARSIWLFTVNDLNPNGKYIEAEVTTGMAARYGFSKIPTPKDIQAARENNEPIKFLGGHFGKKGKEAVIDFSVYKDGLIADARSSTTDTDAFLEDLLTWLTKEFGLLSHKEIVQRKVYASEMHVSTSRSLSLINPKLNELHALISSKADGFVDVRMELGAIGFWADQVLPTKPAPFRFERAEGIAFAENRYYSIAPCKTEAHLDVLNGLEAFLES